MHKAEDSAGEFLIKPNRRVHTGMRMAVVTTPSERCSALDGKRQSARWHQEAGSFIHEMKGKKRKEKKNTTVHVDTVELQNELNE